jgi:hypothetical protein
MPSRMDYVDAALNALHVVLPNEQPVRIVLQEILIAMGVGWLENSDPTPGDMRALDAALARAVALA